MAIAIKNIPILYNDNAKKFVAMADDALAKKNTVDFSKQIKSANCILAKAKMK